MLDLFADEEPWQEPLAPARWSCGVLRWQMQALLAGIEAVTQVSPLRHMVTPGGYTMSVAMTNCGEVGWTTDARGYLYSGIDPQTGNPWPAIPDAFATLCHDAAVAATMRISDRMPA
jgi:alkylated DNA repair protein (DNA oxidative demethylase)